MPKYVKYRVTYNDGSHFEYDDVPIKDWETWFRNNLRVYMDRNKKELLWYEYEQ